MSEAAARRAQRLKAEPAHIRAAPAERPEVKQVIVFGLAASGKIHKAFQSNPMPKPWRRRRSAINASSGGSQKLHHLDPTDRGNGASQPGRDVRHWETSPALPKQL